MCWWIHALNDCIWSLLSAFSLDAEQPDYDLDSEDEVFVNKLKKKMDICPLQFEEMIDRLEKGSGQQVQLHLYIINVYMCYIHIYITWKQYNMGDGEQAFALKNVDSDLFLI